jgi:Lysozyme like domain
MQRSRRHDHRVRWVWALALAALATGAGKLAVTPPSTPTAGHMSLADLRSLAASVGFPDPDLAAAVAMAESSGNPFAVGDGGTSFGLWQIHVPDHPEFDRSSLLTAAYNAHAALLISKSGTDWSPWSAFRYGRYKQFMRTA